MSEQIVWKGWKLTPPIQASTDGEASRSYQRAREKYKELSSALDQIEALVPGAAEGCHGLVFSERAISDAFESIHSITSPQKLRQQHNFLVSGLERGARDLNWQVSIPSPMVTLPRKSPQVTTDTFSQLHGWDTAANIHDQLLPPTKLHQNKLKEWLAGRFLFQLVREGALLNKEWLNQVPSAVIDGIVIEGDIAYLTLKKELKSEQPSRKNKPIFKNFNVNESPEHLFEYERQYQYRRLFLSPMSHLLLLSYYQQCSLSWPQNAGAEKALLHYANSISKEFSNADLASILSVAKTSSSLEMMPLLTHYASQFDVSLSLRPTTWQRLVHRQVLVKQPEDASLEPAYIPIQPLPKRKGKYPDQLVQLIKLQRCIPASLIGQAGRNKAIVNIDNFLSSEEGNGVLVTLLAAWAKRLMQKGGRVKSKLTPSTVRTYRSHIARPLVIHGYDIHDIQALDASEWQKLYENVLNDAKTTGSRSRAQNRLRDFHDFVMDTYSVPDVEIGGNDGIAGRVDVNIITPAEYGRATAIIVSSKQSKRLRMMQALALILGYRLGLRRSECALLMRRDIAFIQHSEDIFGEVIVRANPYRRGKSYSATRRLPLWLLSPLERKILVWCYNQTYKDSKVRTVHKQLLFCPGVSSHDILSDKELFQPIQTALKVASGDTSVRYHHLRHTFVTQNILRFLENNPHELLPKEWLEGESDDKEPYITNFDFSTLAGLPSQNRPSRKRLWQLSLLTGHASPDETLSSYTHLLDWVMGHYLRERFNPVVSSDMQSVLFKNQSKTAVTSWRNRKGLKGQIRASDILNQLKSEGQDYLADNRLEPFFQLYESPAINPLDNATALFTWPNATTIYQCLRLIEQQEHQGVSLGNAIQYAARSFLFAPNQLDRWVKTGEKLMTRRTRRTNSAFSRGDNVNRRSELAASQVVYMPELRRCMAPPLKPQVLKEADQFFHKLLDWCRANPEKAEKSFVTFRNHMQRSTGHIKLPDAVAINTVRDILRPLGCLQHAYLVVEVETNAVEKKLKRHWSQATDIPAKRIMLIPTPSRSGRTRHWYGNAHLKITRGDYKDAEQPLWEAIRFASFMILLVADITDQYD